jgi:hypothetical protein
MHRAVAAARTGRRSALSALRRSALTGRPAPLAGRPATDPPAGRPPGRRAARAYRAVMAAMTASVMNAGLASLLRTGTTQASMQAHSQAPASVAHPPEIIAVPTGHLAGKHRRLTVNTRPVINAAAAVGTAGPAARASPACGLGKEFRAVQRRHSSPGRA